MSNVFVSENGSGDNSLGFYMSSVNLTTADNIFIINNEGTQDLGSFGCIGLGFTTSTVGSITNNTAVPGEGNINTCWECVGLNTETQFQIFQNNSTCQTTGCTNPMACNFNSSATEDDGSCVLLNEACGHLF